MADHPIREVPGDPRCGRRVSGSMRGRPLPERQMQKSEALLSAPLGVSAPGQAMDKFQRRTAGSREPTLTGCPRILVTQGIGLLRSRRVRTAKGSRTRLREQTATLHQGAATARQPVSLNSNFQKYRRKQYIVRSSNLHRHSLNASQQYGRLSRLATANFQRKHTTLGIAHPPLFVRAR